MNRLGLIISTGRTGTQFLSYFINENTTNAFSLHEPSPSRRFKFYSNLYLDEKLKADFIARQFDKSREKYWRGRNQHYYIESNNFLFGCIEPLIEDQKAIKILHVVREPRAYIVSHMKHGFWQGIKKFTAKNIPYWIEKIRLSPQDRNNPIRMLARRWVYVNSVISQWEHKTSYLRVRFEDLFSQDFQEREKTINTIIAYYKLKIKSPDMTQSLLLKKKNIGKKRFQDDSITSADEKYIADCCRELSLRYHYR